MASPFQFFRKRQKALLAVATVFIVFIFVIGSALDPGQSGPADVSSEMVAEWKGGELTAGQMKRLAMNRQITAMFVRQLVGEGIRAGGQLADVESRLPTSLLNQLALDDRIDSRQLEGLIIDTAVWSDAAEQAGIQVSDEVINQVVDELGGRRLNSGDVAQVLAAVSRGDSQSAEAVIFSTIRGVLQAYFYQLSYADASITVMPAQQWEIWRKLEEEISLQAAILPVASFVTETGDPTDSQVEAFYEEFKDREPNPFVVVGDQIREAPSPDPGFAVPRKVQLTFLRGSVAEWTEKLMPEVTDEEIAGYYESNKDRFRLESDDDVSSDDLGVEVDEVDEGDEEAIVDETMQEDDSPEADTPDATEESPAETMEDAAETPADAGEETVDKVDEAADEAGDEARDATDDDGAAMNAPGPFRLAAFQTDATADESEEPAASDEADANDAADATETDEAGDAVDEDAADDPESMDDAQASSDSATDDAAPDEEGEEEEPVADDAETPDGDPEYAPLEAVSEEIRRALAEAKAVERTRSEMRNIYEQLSNRYSKYRREVATAVENETPPPEVPDELTDLKQLAESYGFQAETTAELSQLELYRDTMVGLAFEPDRQREKVWQVAFASLEIGQPYFAVETPAVGSGDCYLVVKVEDNPRTVPPLKEIRGQVAAAWRDREATKLAEEKAQELAAKVADSDRSFVDYMADAGYQVIPQTDMFTWLSFGTAPGGNQTLQLGTVPGLDKVGPGFMEKVFSLKDDETAAVMNVDRSAAYVVKLHSRGRTVAELREDFLRTGWLRSGETVGTARSEMANAVRYSLRESLQVELNEEWLKQRGDEMQQ